LNGVPGLLEFAPYFRLCTRVCQKPHGNTGSKAEIEKGEVLPLWQDVKETEPTILPGLEDYV